MKTPRELILERHRSAERALMGLRGEDLAAAVNASRRRGRILEAGTQALVGPARRAVRACLLSERRPRRGDPTFPRPADADALPWWRQWLWPCPRAWAGLGVAWVVILLLNMTAPDPHPRLASNFAPVTFQSLALLQQQTLRMARSLGPTDDPPAVALPAAPTPRSDRARKQLIG